MNSKYIAHKRESDGKEQSVQEHLLGTAKYAREYASKFGVPDVGELLGLLHDIGKYSQDFQRYIKSATGVINQDADEEYVNAKGLKGKIDHSTAGAQLIWQELADKGQKERLAAKILSLGLVSHHSGLIDCLSPEGEQTFLKRIKKQTEWTHFEEVDEAIEPLIKERIYTIITKTELSDKLLNLFQSLQAPPGADGRIVRLFKFGQMLRMIYSCLIDADRTDTSVFERPRTATALSGRKRKNWNLLINRLENELLKYKQNPDKKSIDLIRERISEDCRSAANREQGIFNLTVPTGGGKTLSSLRFALYHAKKYGLDHIIYVVPFTTIIDQNAETVRTILEPETETFSSILLEHHSNLTPDEECWRGKILSENWGIPVIFTTSVQLLETLFSGGTQSVRRMHQLANSIIIFDEIQSLPIKCVHLFNNSINFLVESCGASVVLCTATQPLLNKVDEKKGTCAFNDTNEIVHDVKKLFDDLKRVEILDIRKIEGYDDAEIASCANSEMNSSGSCLIIVNTKKSALDIYNACVVLGINNLFHLSTDMCPAHRRIIFDEIREQLLKTDREPFICISTQLIEAGVDVDFGSVIRCVAGIDSIAQAAGRCNRHKLRDFGRVLIVNNKNEDLSKLHDIAEGRKAAERVLYDIENDPILKGCDLLSPKALDRFFTYYFFNRSKDMDFPLRANVVNGVGRDDSILNLLSVNNISIEEFCRNYPEKSLDDRNLNQSFAAAGKGFKAIEAPTRGVVVPFCQEGKSIINELCSSFDVEKQYKLLKRAQRFSVNMFPWRFDKLFEAGAIKEVQEGTGIYFLSTQYYDENFGVSNEPINPQEFLNG